MGRPPDAIELAALSIISEPDIRLRVGAARVAAAETIADEQTLSGRRNPARFRQAFDEALKSKGFDDLEERTKYLDALPLTQAAVTVIINARKASETLPDPNADRIKVGTEFRHRITLNPYADPMTVWQQVQSDFKITLEGGPPSVAPPAGTEPGLLSKVGKDVWKLLDSHRDARTLTDEIFNNQVNLAGVTDADRVALITDFYGGTDSGTSTPGAVPVTFDPLTTGLTTSPTTPPSNVSYRTLIGLSTTYKGPSPTTEYQRLQIEIANGKLSLDKAKQQWTETKEKFWQARATATEKLNREKYARAIFESDRSTRLRRDEALLSGRLSAAASGASALVAAAPYLAPRSEFLPGQEPGGSLERLKSFSGAEHTPVRTADASVPFNPFEAADQALAEFERTQGAI
jgi:hypothetical protein